MTQEERSDVTVLLRTEHAVARVLASAATESEAYPALLAAMGEQLHWDFGAVWLPGGNGALRCVASIRLRCWPISRVGSSNRSSFPRA